MINMYCRLIGEVLTNHEILKLNSILLYGFLKEIIYVLNSDSKFIYLSVFLNKSTFQ